jgi:hypothetical protein
MNYKNNKFMENIVQPNIVANLKQTSQDYTARHLSWKAGLIVLAELGLDKKDFQKAIGLRDSAIYHLEKEIDERANWIKNKDTRKIERDKEFASDQTEERLLHYAIDFSELNTQEIGLILEDGLTYRDRETIIMNYLADSDNFEKAKVYFKKDMEKARAINLELYNIQIAYDTEFSNSLPDPQLVILASKTDAEIEKEIKAKYNWKLQIAKATKKLREELKLFREIQSNFKFEYGSVEIERYENFRDKTFSIHLDLNYLFPQCRSFELHNSPKILALEYKIVKGKEQVLITATKKDTINSMNMTATAILTYDGISYFLDNKKVWEPKKDSSSFSLMK